MVRFVVAFVAVVVMGAGMGCGSGGGGNGDVHTSVDSNKPLGSLSSSEIQQLCEDLQATATDPLCDLTGIEVAALLASYNTTATDADLRAACADAAASCKQQGATGNCTSGSGVSSSCTATVGEYLSCVNDTLNLIPACNTITRNSLDALMNAAQPASCTRAQEKCPDLAGSSATAFVSTR